MSLFHRNKKKQEEADSKRASSGLDNATSAPHGRLHTRRKKKSLLQQMKIQASVPATVIDAVHGDNSVINSDKDFIRAPKLSFSDGDYYPVLLLDEESMEKSGLGDKDNKSIFGQISLALKTSSGASGFVPVVTTDSLQQEFVGLLPMHDAFEVLKDYPVINDYRPGWLVGLLRIDNDELVLSKTDLRLTIPEWWQFINKKLDLVVSNDRLRKSTDVPESSDPLAVNSAEEAGGAAIPHVAQSAALPTGEFDDDDGPASNSNINNFINSQSDSTQDSGNDAEGYAIPGLDGLSDADDSLSDSNQNNSQGNDDNANGISMDDLDSMPLADQSDNGGSDNDQPLSGEISNAPVDSNTVPDVSSADDSSDHGLSLDDTMPSSDQLSGQLNNSNLSNEPDQSNQSQYVMAQNRDELDAQNVTLSSSVRTLNDLSVSISDAEFINAYLKPLTIEHLPLLDESDDPTGYRHHQNALRQQANAELDGALRDAKVQLRSWFEVQRSSILSVLQEKTTRQGSEVNRQRDVVQDLENQLADENALREAARIDVQDQLDDLDAQFESSHKAARQAAIAEVETQFNDRRQQLSHQKDDLINSATAARRDSLSKKMGSAKAKIRDLAQTAASASYQDVMTQGAEQFHAVQQMLAQHRRQVLDKIDADEKAARKIENQRAENAAVVAKHDTTIEQLKAQLKAMEQHNAQALKEAKDNAEVQVRTVQAQADAAQHNAVASVERDLKQAQQDRESLKAELAQQRKDANTREDEITAKYEKKLSDVQASLKDARESTDRSNHRTVRNSIAAFVLGTIIVGGAGYLGGELHATKMQPTTQQHATTNTNGNNGSQAPMIIQVPGNNSSDNSSNSHSESNKSNSNSESYNAQNNSSNRSSTNSENK